MKRFSSVGAAAYRSCSTFLSRAYSRSVTSIFWYRSCRACRDVHTSAAPSLESDPDRQTDRRWSADVRWQNQHCSYDWSSAEDWTLAPNVWSDSSCRLYLWSQRLNNKWSCDTQTSRRHKHNSHTDSAFIKQLLQTLHVLSTFLSSCVSHLCCKLTTETLSEVVEVKPEQKSPDVELILTDSPLIMMMTVFWVQSCTWDTRTRINTTHTSTLLSLDWQLQPHLHRSSHLYSPLTTHT